ncbi:MAG: hypothetical protein HWE10_06245 [Gammaproteobacteria bacterium]|nr:hypothetical protein [Gammaproteobacteria bacterium]
MLQIVEWREGVQAKKVGKLNSGETSDLTVSDKVIAILVYSSSATKRRYVTGLQIIYN